MLRKGTLTEVTKRNTEVTKRNTEVTKKNTEVTKRNTEVTKRNAEVTKGNTEVTKRNKSTFVLYSCARHAKTSSGNNRGTEARLPSRIQPVAKKCK